MSPPPSPFPLEGAGMSGGEEEGMGLIKIFTKSHCPKCPAAREMGVELKKEGVPVLNYDLDTIDGLAEASFYSILSTPSIVIEDEEEKELISWRGVVPTLQEVKQYLLRGIS
jgi:thiol-disulfide isomerase/thioredoxin